MARIMDFVTKMTLANGSHAPGHTPDPAVPGNNVVMNVLCSIARTNLELEVVQRGGNLLQQNSTSTTSGNLKYSHTLAKDDFKDYCFSLGE